MTRRVVLLVSYGSLFNIIRSSSEISSPLDFDSALTARLQVASLQPPVTDYAVLPNSEALGAGVPSLLPYLAEEGLVSFTKRLFLG